MNRGFTGSEKKIAAKTKFSTLFGDYSSSVEITQVRAFTLGQGTFAFGYLKALTQSFAVCMK